MRKEVWRQKRLQTTRTCSLLTASIRMTVQEPQDSHHQIEKKPPPPQLHENNLSLNFTNIKKLVVDYGRNEDRLTPIDINGSGVERVNSFKFLGINVAKDFTKSVHISNAVKESTTVPLAPQTAEEARYGSPNPKNFLQWHN